LFAGLGTYFRGGLAGLEAGQQGSNDVVFKECWLNLYSHFGVLGHSFVVFKEYRPFHGLFALDCQPLVVDLLVVGKYRF